MRYVALLGSINVGGNRVAMADLRAAFSDAGFAGVTTVGASGNVIFGHDQAADAVLETRVAKRIADVFGFDTFAAVRSREELVAALAENPFVGVGADKLVHVGFLDGDMDEAAFARLVADHAGRGNEKLAPGTRALHIDYGEGVGDSKLTKAFIERRLGRRITARNVSSIRRIIEKMG